MAACPRFRTRCCGLEHEPIYRPTARDLRGDHAAQRETVEHALLASGSLQRDRVVVHGERILQNHRRSRRAGALAVSRIVEQHDVGVACQCFERVAAFDGTMKRIASAEHDHGAALRVVGVRDADEAVTAMNDQVLHGVAASKNGTSRRPVGGHEVRQAYIDIDAATGRERDAEQSGEQAESETVHS